VSIDDSIHRLIDQVVDAVPSIKGALVSSADGFVIASRLPDDAQFDDAAIAAMSAATLGLANRLVQITGPERATTSVQRSASGQVHVFGVAHVAVLTIMAAPDANSEQLDRVGHEVCAGLLRLFRETAAD
jgi:predicted regulator of Ras-like GTPase activity (Roadblock/LC7/MglB family)